jgi:hypothetical protein
MKALISPNESFTWTWVTSWEWGPTPTRNDPEKMGWIPDTTSSIENCQRVAQVEPNDKIFEVAQPLHWVDCSDDCQVDQWYFKDGVCLPKPQDVSPPNNPPEV